MIAQARRVSSIDSGDLFSNFRRNTLPASSGRDHSAFVQHRVIVQQPAIIWWDKLESRLNELTALPRGWDGYRGRPVSYTCASFAASILERIYVEGLAMPSLVPGSDGTLQIEWHLHDYDIELDVLDANKVVAIRFDCRHESEQEVQLTNDFKLVTEWIGDLMARTQVAAAAA
jgi:hypothetical protein